MGSNTVSHNTESMRNWSAAVEDYALEYDRLINSLYALVEQFANSKDFRGGLSEDFLDKFINQKTQFLSYSEIFRECSELINKTATKIDNDHAELKSRIQRNNPFN